MDKEASTVWLVHFTHLEHLRTRAGPFGIAYPKIAETCLSWLNLQQLKPLSQPVLLPISNTRPFSASKGPSRLASGTHPFSNFLLNIEESMQKRTFQTPQNCSRGSLTAVVTAHPLKSSGNKPSIRFGKLPPFRVRTAPPSLGFIRL